jgi:hypothetical protein
MRDLKNECEGVSVFYGTGTAYISDGSQVHKVLEHNFAIESLGPDGGDFYMYDGLAVALSGNLKPKLAVKALQLVIRKIESDGKA